MKIDADRPYSTAFARESASSSVREPVERRDRAEHLLAGQEGVVGEPLEQRGREQERLVVEALAACEQRAAVGAALLDPGQHLLELRLVHDRPDLGRGIGRVADDAALDPRDAAASGTRRRRAPRRGCAASPCTSAPPTRTRPAYAASTARPRSASAMTISGLWPPSSSWTRLPSAVASPRTWRPTATEPVNETARTSACSTSGVPTAEPRPTTTLKTPAGMPPSSRHAARWRPVQRRVLRELHHDRVAVGERRRRLPGRDRRREVPRRDQRDDAERTPQGVGDASGRRLLVALPGRRAALRRRRSGGSAPCAPTPSRASRIGLPISSVMSCAICSTRRSTASAAFRSTSPRAAAGSARPGRERLGGGGDGVGDVGRVRGRELADRLRLDARARASRRCRPSGSAATRRRRSWRRPAGPGLPGRLSSR